MMSSRAHGGPTLTESTPGAIVGIRAKPKKPGEGLNCFSVLLRIRLRYRSKKRTGIEENDPCMGVGLDVSFEQI
jgi:hypothetical protein